MSRYLKTDGYRCDVCDSWLINISRCPRDRAFGECSKCKGLRWGSREAGPKRRSRTR